MTASLSGSIPGVVIIGGGCQTAFKDPDCILKIDVTKMSIALSGLDVVMPYEFFYRIERHAALRHPTPVSMMACVENYFLPIVDSSSTQSANSPEGFPVSLTSGSAQKITKKGGAIEPGRSIARSNFYSHHSFSELIGAAISSSDFRSALTPRRTSASAAVTMRREPAK